MKLLDKHKLLIVLLGLLFSTNVWASECQTPTQLEIKNFLYKLMTYHNDKTSIKAKDILSKEEYKRFQNNEDDFWLTLNEVFTKEVNIKLKRFPKSCDGLIGFTYRTYSKDGESSSESNLNFIIKREKKKLVIVETQVAG